MSDHQHIESTGLGDHVYRIAMGGTVDGEMTRSPVGYQAYTQGFEPNVCVTLENVGDRPITNPWLIANGKDWRSVKSIVEGVIDEGMTDREKALALWTYQKRHRFHASPYDNDNRTPVKMFNVYGYTLCGDDSYVLADLCREAGLRVRAGHPIGHSTTEVFFDGMWHLLDGDEHVICLMRDNETIAGEEEIVYDHDLMKRTHVYGILRHDDRETDEFSAALFPYEGEREEHKGQYPCHTMDMVLRPGESLAWRWDHTGKFHGTENIGSWRAWHRICNGSVVYIPDLTADSWRIGTEDTIHVVDSGPLIGDGGGRWSVTFDTKVAYVLLGGRVDATLRHGGEGRSTLEFSVDGQTWQEVWATDREGEQSVVVSLDRHFPSDGEARYGWKLRLSGPSCVSAPLSDLKIASHLQMAPLSLPGVQLGKNAFRYVDDSDERSVRITHDWREREDLAPPDEPKVCVYPPDGKTVEGTRFAFQWEPVSDAADYAFVLAGTPDCDRSLSPNFEKLVSKTAEAGQARYTIPYDGLLNPGEMYYWRVRARNEDGVWGDWGPVWSFVPEGPGVPLGVKIEMSDADHSGSLAWSENPKGRRPATYRVYASDERGFSVSDSDYNVVAAKGRTERRRGNFWKEVEGTYCPVIGENGSGVNRAHYRVVAVDEAGNRSGPSDYATARRPFISGLSCEEGYVRQRFESRVLVIASEGDLRTITIDGNPYNPAFRDADPITFSLLDAPLWMSIDRDGHLSGTPTQAGSVEVRVEVSLARVGKDERSLDVRIREA